LLTYLSENKDLRIDTLIIEETNIGSSSPPITPGEASQMIVKLASSHRPLIATLHPFDMEYAYFLAKLIADLGLRFYIASDQTAMLRGSLNQPIKPSIIGEYVSYPTFLERSTLDEVEEQSIILVSYREVVDLLRDVALIKPSLLNDTVAVISEPEPERKEATKYSVLANWFSKLGVQHYIIRASGHYYPCELKLILAEIKPRKYNSNTYRETQALRQNSQ
jgi:ribonuclease J